MCRHLGLDFGNDASKACLSFQNSSGETEIIRISLNGLPQGHPDRTPHTNVNDFSFPSGAVLEGGRFRTGRYAQHKPDTIQLKTMLTYVAGCGREAVDGCPDGPKLLALVDDADGTNGMTAEMMHHLMRAALNNHFNTILEMARDQAVAAGLYITVVTLSRPTYLQDRSAWLESYETELLKIVSWVLEDLGKSHDGFLASDIRFFQGSEGQCMGLYVCEQFEDPLGSFNRERFLDALGDLGDGKNQVNWLVADTGGSTLVRLPLSPPLPELIVTAQQNLHVQTTYVEGGKVSSQTNLGHGWKLGAQGGSQTANRLMRDELRERLSPNIPADELAKILEQFETAKYTYDYMRPDNPTTVLHGLTGSYRQMIAPQIFNGALEEAFQPGIDATDDLIKRVCALRQDFAVVACGGTSGNPGYQSTLRQCIALKWMDARRGDFKIKLVFLPDYDRHAYVTPVPLAVNVQI